MFWDSSALVPLLLPEDPSEALTRLLADDDEPVIWWATPLECQSALQRRHREAPLPADQLSAAIERLRQLPPPLVSSPPRGGCLATGGGARVVRRTAAR
jgi:uncharacterized protein with PIN domain